MGEQMGDSGGERYRPLTMMDFLIVGGGCFGSFYTRQLLRGAERIGLGKIHIVDHDPYCQAVREHGQSPQLVFHNQDWKPFLLDYFADVFRRRDQGETVLDQYVPPTFAPHILLEIFLELGRRESPSARFDVKPYEGVVGTPVDMALPTGMKALSFATWICPAACIEPPTCPHTRGPKAWDMKEFLSKHPFAGVDEVYVFPCRHLTMGVGTIPVKMIADDYVRFRATAQAMAKTPGTHRIALATVSSCHGLIGLVEVKHE